MAECMRPPCGRRYERYKKGHVVERSCDRRAVAGTRGIKKAMWLKDHATAVRSQVREV